MALEARQKTLDNVNINFLFSRVTTNTSNFLVATHQVLPTRQSMAQFPPQRSVLFHPVTFSSVFGSTVVDM